MHDASQEAERKLAAIMAADVVGFSRLMGADEAATLASLRDARRVVIDPLIAGNRGRIFKVMGDGLLVEFPSSMLALRAALAIQAALAGHGAASPEHPRIVLRIGIHQGDVLVHGDDLLGEGVNIAARLEPLAPQGGICISARVREDAFGKMVLPFEDGGERLLKNIARPMRVFLLRSPEPGGSAARGPAHGHTGARGHEEDDRTLLLGAQDRRHGLTVMESTAAGPAPGHVVVLTARPLILGRQSPSDLILPGAAVSRTHCRLELADGGAVITDLRSTNGTFVDDRRIAEPTRLVPGGVIRIGPYAMGYAPDGPEADPGATHVWRG